LQVAKQGAGLEKIDVTLHPEMIADIDTPTLRHDNARSQGTRVNARHVRLLDPIEPYMSALSLRQRKQASLFLVRNCSNNTSSHTARSIDASNNVADLSAQIRLSNKIRKRPNDKLIKQLPLWEQSSPNTPFSTGNITPPWLAFPGIKDNERSAKDRKQRRMQSEGEVPKPEQAAPITAATTIDAPIEAKRSLDPTLREEYTSEPSIAFDVNTPSLKVEALVNCLCCGLLNVPSFVDSVRSSCQQRVSPRRATVASWNEPNNKKVIDAHISKDIPNFDKRERISCDKKRVCTDSTS
jgi:hypothetical protein